jgi:hypothetical protein
MRLSFQHPKLLTLLWLADAAFIALHLLHVYTDLLPSRQFWLSLPRGYGEFFQYTKFLWISALFLALGARYRRPIYFVLALAFLYLLIDDSFEFHEIFGGYLADFFQLPALFGLRARDLGELLVSATFGGLLLAAGGLAYAVSSPFERQIARAVLLMVLALALFGVVFDMLEIITPGEGASRVLALLEEGGELLVASLIAWFAFVLDPRTERLPLAAARPRRKE